jgi:hypothetical protein
MLNRPIRKKQYAVRQHTLQMTTEFCDFIQILVHMLCHYDTLQLLWTAFPVISIYETNPPQQFDTTNDQFMVMLLLLLILCYKVILLSTNALSIFVS